MKRCSRRYRLTLPIVRLWFGAAPWVLAAQIVTITPTTLTQCTNGLGHATIAWNAPAGQRVRVHVLSATGPPMTGLENAAGSAQTGDWVRDGMAFYVVNDAGQELGRVVAEVNCGGTADTTNAAFSTASAWFPLQVGNRWVYRSNSRSATSTYTVWSLTGTTLVGSDTWFVLEIRASGAETASTVLYRCDESGRIYRIPNYQGAAQELWLDAASTGQTDAVLQVQQRDVAVATPFGSLPGLTYQTSVPLSLEAGTLVRGLGLLKSEAQTIAGSSGGFSSSLELVEAKIGKAVYYVTPSTGVSVAAESSTFDVTGHHVTNCAIPCYFVACGFGGADPPNTYKPCFQARIRAGVAQCDRQTPLDTQVQLTDAGGSTVYEQAVGLSATPQLCDSAQYLQVPLYSAPNVGLPAGDYRLSVTVRSVGAEIGSASMPLKVQ
ncbi:MAG: hypothetical protein ABI693_33915 [Bryobacteraceae bacterium]